jgi:hypothetical protein
MVQPKLGKTSFKTLKFKFIAYLPPIFEEIFLSVYIECIVENALFVLKRVRQTFGAAFE